jgi:hypothetical protein
MSTWPARKKRPRGSVILLAIFFLIILFSLSVSFFKIIPAEFHSAAQAQRLTQAHYAADAGVRKAVAWLENQTVVTDTMMSTFTTDNGCNPSLDWDDAGYFGTPPATNFVDQDWSFTVRISANNASNLLYDVVSTAFFRGREIRSIRSTVQNESFSKYALFYDTWGADLPFGLGENVIQGPFHTNGYFQLMADDTTFSGGGDPFCSGPLAEMTHSATYTPGGGLSAGEGNQYTTGNYAGTNPNRVPYDLNTGQPNTARYNRIIEGGRNKISITDRIDLPEATTDLQGDGWGGTLPANAAAWNALVASNGPVLVNTASGPNTPGGQVSGGIYIRGDATSARFEITPEGHQKTRVRHGNETVPGGTETWWVNVPVYGAWVQPPDYQDPIWECVASHQEDQPVGSWQTCTGSTTGPSAANCGTTTQYVMGEGGITVPIQVPNTCTYSYNYSCWQQTGTQTVTVCDDWDITGYNTVTPPAQWNQPVDATFPGATQVGTTPQAADPGDPGAYSVAGTVSIQNWNSVVEVNDANYSIPFQAGGVKVNGTLVTDPNDPILTVPDGNTVSIRHDVIKDGVNYAEYTIMPGRINGVVFADGHLPDTQGVVKGSKYEDAEGNLGYHGRTLATNIQANKRIDISGDLLQFYDGNGMNGQGQPLNDGQNRLAPGNHSPTDEHILGVVAYDINLRTGNNSSNWSGNNSLDVYGVLMAGRRHNNNTPNNPADDYTVGGFGAHDSNMQSNDGLGDFRLFGGIVSGVARKTQQPYNNGSYLTGFRLALNYDPIAALNLENFPTTNNFSLARYVNIPAGDFHSMQ